MTIRGKLTSVILGLLSLFAIQSVSAQEDEITYPKFGFGVSLFNLTEYMSTDNGPASLIYMTMNIGKKFRLEPEFGFVLYDGLEEYTFGVGGFGRKPISKFNFLYGLRLGISSDETEFIAPTIGGEYYFIRNFSIGSEIQFKGLISPGGFGIFTNSNVIVRFYF
jgi:hypothetical protein